MRLVAEARQEDPELSMHQAVPRTCSRVGVNADTLHRWCKQPDIDAEDGPTPPPATRWGSSNWRRM